MVGFSDLNAALDEIRPGFPHAVELDERFISEDGLHADETIAWCTERFGADGIRVEVTSHDQIYYNDHAAQWFMCYQIYYFKDARHALEFKMRWV